MQRSPPHAAASPPLVDDGHERIVLTPTPSEDAVDQVYDHVSSPPSSVPPFRRHSSHRPKTSTSDHTVVATKALFAACLLLATSVRATAVSSIYLFVFCSSVVHHSFESRALTLLTLVVALVACVCHGVIQGIDSHDGENTADVSKVIGFSRTHKTVLEYLQTIGVDVLVFVSSSAHYWSVTRTRDVRLSMEKEMEDTRRQHLDLFEMGEHFRNDRERKRDCRRSMIQAVELLTALLLFLTSVSVPAFASGVLYLVLVARLIVYTVCVRRVTVQELVARDSSATFVSLFLGPVVTNVLLVWCLVIIFAWYTLRCRWIGGMTWG